MGADMKITSVLVGLTLSALPAAAQTPAAAERATQAAATVRSNRSAAPSVDNLDPWPYLQCRYMATTQVAKWGNSLGLRLPKAIAVEAQIDEGDTVDVSIKNGAIVIRPSRPTYSLAGLVSKITPRNRHRETDWGEAAGDEAW